MTGKFSNDTFAANLVEQRKYQVRITQEELARRSGVDQNTISAYENGKAWPNFETAWELCDLYGLSTMDELAAASSMRSGRRRSGKRERGGRQ